MRKTVTIINNYTIYNNLSLNNNLSFNNNYYLNTYIFIIMYIINDKQHIKFYRCTIVRTFNNEINNKING